MITVISFGHLKDAAYVFGWHIKESFIWLWLSGNAFSFYFYTCKHIKRSDWGTVKTKWHVQAA